MSSVGGSPMEATLSTPPMRGTSCAQATDTDRTRTVTRATRLFIAGILRGKKVARMIPSAVVLNVLVARPFGEGGLDRLRAVSPDLRVSAGDAERADYARTDVLYAGSPPHDLARAPRLKWVEVHMAGVNALYDHPLYAKSQIPITTTSGVHAATIAEYALTVILALAHRVPRMVEWRAEGAWPPDEQRWPLFVPTELRGAALGVIGYGSIGRELARMATTALGMRVLACKRDPSRRADDGYRLPGTGDPEGALPEAWFAPARLHDLLARSDVVVMCAPLTSQTRAMIGAAELAAMKPSAFFVNVGRGATVDEAALAAALKAGRLARARGAAARSAADAHRSRHAVRRVPATVLAAGGLRARPRRRAAAHPDHGRGPRGLPRPLGPRRPAAAAVLPPRDLARVRHPPGARHPLLLSRLGLRRGRSHPRDARRARRQHAQAAALPRGVPDPRVLRPRLRLHGAARRAARLPDVRHVRRAGPRAAPGRAVPAAVQLAPGEGQLDGPRAHVLPARDQQRLSFHRGLRGAGGIGVAGDGIRHALRRHPPCRRLRLGADLRLHGAQRPPVHARDRGGGLRADRLAPRRDPLGRARGRHAYAELRAGAGRPGLGPDARADRAAGVRPVR